MPLSNEILGTNADGSTNEDYCIYCYKDGKFLQDMTMEQMIDHCAQFTDEINQEPARQQNGQGEPPIASEWLRASASMPGDAVRKSMTAD